MEELEIHSTARNFYGSFVWKSEDDDDLDMVNYFLMGREEEEDVNEDDDQQIVSTICHNKLKSIKLLGGLSIYDQDLQKLPFPIFINFTNNWSTPIYFLPQRCKQEPWRRICRSGN